MIDYIIHQYNLFVDGIGFAGKSTDVQLPNIKPMMQEYGEGGMAGKVDIPMGCIEKMEFGCTVNSFHPLLLNHTPITLGQTTRITARATGQDANGAKHAIIARMEGKLMVEKDPWKTGEAAILKLAQSVDVYQLLIDGIEHEYADPQNMVVRIGGVDQLAIERGILGV